MKDHSYSTLCVHGVTSVTIEKADKIKTGANVRTIAIETDGGLIMEIVVFSNSPDGIKIKKGKR